VKDKIDQLVTTAEIRQRRIDEGRPVAERDFNMLFTGPAGTGKTTVANRIGPLLGALNLTANPDQKPIIVTGDEIKSIYKGGSAKQARQVFERARGGVLFIDEAYAIKSSDGDDYGQEAINALLPLVEDKGTVVILGGYPDELKRLLGTNPGLPSRFPESVPFTLPTKRQRAKILTSTLEKNGYKFDQAALKEVKDAVDVVGEEGNARDIVNGLMNQVLNAQEMRLSLDSSADMDLITEDDVREGAQGYKTARRFDDGIERKRR